MRGGHAKAATIRPTITATIGRAADARANAVARAARANVCRHGHVYRKKATRIGPRTAPAGTAIVATDILPLQIARQIVGQQKALTPTPPDLELRT